MLSGKTGRAKRTVRKQGYNAIELRNFTTFLKADAVYPCGNIISPIRANIYMHYVLVLWYKAYIEKHGKGNSFLVVYADDYLAGFDNKWEAERSSYREM
ncbi:MAG: hypothetical protein E7255_14305 [Lachnospiraceae bacterium]|nr:hypothetical protein [Lachnospiraceae bacterium]